MNESSIPPCACVCVHTRASLSTNQRYTLKTQQIRQEMVSPWDTHLNIIQHTNTFLHTSLTWCFSLSFYPPITSVWQKAVTLGLLCLNRLIRKHKESSTSGSSPVSHHWWKKSWLTSPFGHCRHQQRVRSTYSCCCHEADKSWETETVRWRCCWTASVSNTGQNTWK